MQASGAEPEASSHGVLVTSTGKRKRTGQEAEQSGAAEAPVKKKSATPSRKKKKKRAPPKVKLLNADERSHLLGRIVKEDVLA